MFSVAFVVVRKFVPIFNWTVLHLAGKILGPDIPHGPCNVSCQSTSVPFRLPQPPGRHRSAATGYSRQQPGRYRSAAICLRQQPGCPWPAAASCLRQLPKVWAARRQLQPWLRLSGKRHRRQRFWAAAAEVGALRVILALQFGRTHAHWFAA